MQTLVIFGKQQEKAKGEEGAGEEEAKDKGE